ncbi:kinase-like domain-containing protein [Trametes polyzona]|nr:kinase-like domain-containing protein [Trametes polyzona]
MPFVPALSKTAGHVKVMSAPTINLGRLPRYAFMSPETTERHVEMARKGTYDLTPCEKMWRDRQPYLLQRGYALRPRYAPDWRPSWRGTNINPFYCEDSIMTMRLNVIDARTPDGQLVAIKRFQDKAQEVEIGRFLTSIKQPENHCVEVIDAFPDPQDPTWTFLVMPYLRPFNNPEFELVGEVIDFVRQMLEGLAFLHSHSIAHRDIAALNVMMDGSRLYPHGHHPVRLDSSLDAVEQLAPLRRIDHEIKYYYIDFGLSVRFPPGASPQVVGDVGRDAEVPELSWTVPYDAFKADVYALGNLFYKEFVLKYLHTEFLNPLINCMKQKQPELRPPAGELVGMFKQLCKLENPSKARWRLSPRTESAPERMINDAVSAVKGGIMDIKRFVG